MPMKWKLTKTSSLLSLSSTDWFNLKSSPCMCTVNEYIFVVYMIKIIWLSELRIKNISERDLRSCEVTQNFTNKAQKNIIFIIHFQKIVMLVFILSECCLLFGYFLSAVNKVKCWLIQINFQVYNGYSII